MKKKILIIDDDPDVAEVLGVYLESMGYAFDIVKRGIEGIEALKEGDYFALFTDYMMPDLKGNRIISEVAEKHPQMRGRLFLITGAPVEIEIKQEIAASGGRIISKPFTRETLLKALGKI